MFSNSNFQITWNVKFCISSCRYKLSVLHHTVYSMCKETQEFLSWTDVTVLYYGSEINVLS